MHCKQLIFSGHFWVVLMEFIIVGMIALTLFGFMALVIASAAACAAVFTGVILSPTAASVGARSTTKYGSTFGETFEC